MTVDRAYKKLENKLKTYLDDYDVKLVKKAFQFAEKAHEGQLRKSNVLYIFHPIEVAQILSELEQSVDTIIAGLLHDVIEDTEISHYDIKKIFGEKVHTLVDGVTKLSKFKFSSKEEEQAENYRRMFIAMAKDYRVIIIKLADRLHNLRTLNYLTLKKQKEIAQETLDIYAPLAHRLGIYSLKWEMEDLAFFYLKSESFYEIKELLDQNRDERESYVNSVIKQVRHMMTRHKLTTTVSGRSKNVFGIYKKLNTKKITFNELYDLIGVRIIVDSIQDCYIALGLLHEKFKPVSERFKDYIALPKQNGYQSIHTTTIGPQGRPIEFQIRTSEMNHIAEYGFASHWKYQSKKAVLKFEGHLEWLSQMLEDQKEDITAKDFIDTLKMDLDMDEVFVFTPKGDLKVLRLGSTALDFAYFIHTDIGHHCQSIIINGEEVPFNYTLCNGDRIQVVTDMNVVPNLDRLRFVTSRHSRYKIKQWLNRENKKYLIQKGKQRLENFCFKKGLIFEDCLAQVDLKLFLKQCQFKNFDELYINIEQDNVSVHDVLQYIVKQLSESHSQRSSFFVDETDYSHMTIKKDAPLKFTIAKCCMPLPGDDIGSVVVVGKGVTIHRIHCHNLVQVKKKHVKRVFKMSWNEILSEQKIFQSSIKIEGYDRKGLLQEVLQVFSDHQLNLRSVITKLSVDQVFMVTSVTADFGSLKEFYNVKQSLSKIHDVTVIVRKGRS